MKCYSRSHARTRLPPARRIRLRGVADHMQFLAVASLLASVGCGGGGSGAGGDAALESSAQRVSSAVGSIYGQSTYDVQALLVNSSNKPTPLPALAVYGSPMSTFRKHMRPFEEQYESELKAIQQSIAKTDAEIKEKEAELEAERAHVANEFAETAPKGAKRPAAKSRDPLGELSKIRAAEEKWEERLKSAYRERLAPIEATLQSLGRVRYETLCEREALQASLKNRRFEAVESMPSADRKIWKTAENGKVRITVTNEEPWIVWAKTKHAEMVAMVTTLSGNVRTSRTAEFRSGGGNPRVKVDSTESYDMQFKSRPEFQITSARWLLEIPRELDANGVLSMDQNTSYEVKDLALDPVAGDGPYLKKAGGRE